MRRVDCFARFPFRDFVNCAVACAHDGRRAARHEPFLAQCANSYFDNSAQNGVAFFPAPLIVQEENLSVDLFPESAAIRNVWEHKLALVKGERVGAVVATEG